MARICRYAVLVVVLLATGPLWASTSVWKISDGDRHFYLGGTMHVLKKQDYPLPEAFGRAYQASDTLVLEADLTSISQARFESLVLSEVFYPPDDDLKRHLNAEAYDALKAYCESIGIPVKSLLKMRPGLVVSTITMTELQKLGVDQIGVDAFFAAKAQADHKTIKALETVQQQIAFLAEMGRGYESQLILQTLAELKHLPEDIDALRKAWRTGDMQALNALAVEPMKSDYPRVYRRLIVDRNKAWIGQIRQFMQTPAVEFILVGAAHIAGAEGLLVHLERRGFTVTQMD